MWGQYSGFTYNHDCLGPEQGTSVFSFNSFLRYSVNLNLESQCFNLLIRCSTGEVIPLGSMLMFRVLFTIIYDFTFLESGMVSNGVFLRTHGRLVTNIYQRLFFVVRLFGFIDSTLSVQNLKLYFFSKRFDSISILYQSLSLFFFDYRL